MHDNINQALLIILFIWLSVFRLQRHPFSTVILALSPLTFLHCPTLLPLQYSVSFLYHNFYVSWNAAHKRSFIVFISVILPPPPPPPPPAGWVTTHTLPINTALTRIRGMCRYTCCMNTHNMDRSVVTVYAVAIETALFQVWRVKMKKVAMNYHMQHILCPESLHTSTANKSLPYWGCTLRYTAVRYEICMTKNTPKTDRISCGFPVIQALHL